MLLVRTLKSCASVVPKKLFVGFVPELPISDQALAKAATLCHDSVPEPLFVRTVFEETLRSR